MNYSKNELTGNQLTIRSIVIDMRRDLIGGMENHYMDNGVDYNPELYTKQWAVNTIYEWLVCGDSKYVDSPLRNIAIERKHIKFYGKEWLLGLIEDRIEYDYHKNGWAFPNNYEGGNK